MADLASIHARQSAYQDSMLAAFTDHLRNVTMRAQSRVLAELQKRLAITGEAIDQTAGNLRVIRQVGRIWMAELDRAGINELFESFVREFRGQLPYLQDVLRYLSDQMETPLPALGDPLQLTTKDQGILAGLQANTVTALEVTMESAGYAAMQRGMFSVGGLKFGDLVESLVDRLDTSIAKARTIADTAMSTFYRTATDRAFQAIERGATGVKYRYSGPVDKLERPFCRHLTDVDKAYTRAQIDLMNNGQMPSVWLTAGGWNCRHSWILDTSTLEVRAMEAA